MAELADAELVKLFENNKTNMITKSEELYGSSYSNELSMQIDKLENNITEFRKIISSLFFYSENGYNTKEMLENVMTLVGNASAIPIMHFNEIYLAKARTSNRYVDHVEINNPVTKDGIIPYFILLGLSLIGITCSIKCNRINKIN